MTPYRFRHLLFRANKKLREQMPGGRKPDTSDIEILRAMALYPGPGVSSTELADLFDMRQQGMYSRLSSFVDDGLVEYRTIGGTNVYRLTLTGQKYVAKRVLENYD